MMSVYCPSAAPDGSVSCTKLPYHQAQGSLECKNTATGQSWCGYCATWVCELHGVFGVSEPNEATKEWRRFLSTLEPKFGL